MSRSTSSPVRYSRCRRSALGSRFGGGTFPFTMVGAPSRLAVFAFVFIDPAYHTFPFMGINGLSRLRWLGVMALEARNPAEAGRHFLTILLASCGSAAPVASGARRPERSRWRCGALAEHGRLRL